MSDKKYFTAVFEVSDHDQFMIFARQVSGAMFGEHVFEGASVTGCGWGDSMTEADRMREFLDDEGYDSESIARGEK